MSASGHTTVPMSRPSRTMSPSPASAALTQCERLPHARVCRHLRDSPRDLGATDGLAHITSAHMEARGLRLVRRLRNESGMCVATTPNASPSSSDTPSLERDQGDRPVHRAGVEIREAEPARHPQRDGALARTRRTVDGDDHRSLPSPVNSCHRSSERGVRHVDAGDVVHGHSLPRAKSGEGAHHGQTVVAARSDGAAAPTLGTAGDIQAVRMLDHIHAQGAEERGYRREAVALLDPEFRRSPQARGAPCPRGRQSPHGNLIDEQWHLIGVHIDRCQLARKPPSHCLSVRRRRARRAPLPGALPWRSRHRGSRCGWD